MWQVWPVSLAYGGVFAAVAIALMIGLFSEGAQALILTLSAGFLIVGPILAVGL